MSRIVWVLFLTLGMACSHPVDDGDGGTPDGAAIDAGANDAGATDGGGIDGGGTDGGGPPPGPDTATPYPIDQGDDASTPGSYQGLPLRLVDNGAPTITAVRGVIGLVCIGMSNSNQECDAYISEIQRSLGTQINAEVVVVNCAVGGNAIERWNDPSRDANLWDACIDTRIGQQGVALDQVRVVYHKAADQFTTSAPNTPLPLYPNAGSDYENFIANLGDFATRVTTKFPAVQAVYTTSRSYGGWGSVGRDEPLSYEEGHALNTWLAANPAVGGVWFGWGPYIWAPDCASGVTNASGVCYDRSDYQGDGIHPASGANAKIVQMIHDRFLREAWYRP